MDSSRLAARLFSSLVIVPVRLAHRALGDGIWSPLEALAAGLGAVAGTVARPLLGSGPPEAHPLAPVVRLTNLVEGSLGIEGTDEFLDPETARRTVHRCPFAADLTYATQFCTRLGCTAGKAASRSIVPGSDFEVLATLSRGDPHCEYVFSKK